jgi:ubiquinone/menaquinone biosynthesis C-methylase UbiE
MGSRAPADGGCRSCEPRPKSASRRAADPIRIYDRIARVYELYIPPWEQRAARAAVSELALKAGSTVLEPGCGTGLHLPLLVERVGPTGRIVGLDPNEAMLSRAAAKVETHGWSNVILLGEDGSELSAEFLWDRAGLREVDALLFSYVLSVMRDWESIFEKAFALLRSGGRCVILDLKTTEGPLRILNRPRTAFYRRTGAADIRRPISDLLGRAAGDVRVASTFSGFGFVASATKP